MLSKKLKEKYKNDKRVKIYNVDILKINLENILKKNTIVFGNLPYNISSQILVKFIKLQKMASQLYRFNFYVSKRIR